MDDKWKWKEDQRYRPLQMIHGIVPDPDENPELVRKQMEDRLFHVKEIGCGGVVTNMGPKNYLQKEEHWKIFLESLKLCRKFGLKVWLYDEEGYPSGGAGGLTLKGHPEYEAYGLCCLKFHVDPTTHLCVPKPKGHEKVAAVYGMEGDIFEPARQIDLMDHVDGKGTLCFDSTFSGEVYYLVTKPLFEGVHASRNYHRIRRYIDVLDKEAVGRFIEITYEAYKKYAGEYFGDLIEAIFTDEPSVMGGYLPVLKVDPESIMQDRPDEQIPLYPFVVWSRNFEKEFRQRKGYDILPVVPLLFARENLSFRQVRKDYYEVVTALYEEAYFKAIGDWCRENHLLFTGHLLAEETLCQEVLEEGEFFQLMRHMDATGIDMLTADPARVAQFPLLPKIASSAAHQYKKSFVMSETSDFMERQRGEETPPKRVFASIAAQYACGVTRFTSYFHEDKYEPETYKKIYDGVSRIGQFIGEGNHIRSLLIYYPARTAWQFMTPSSQINEARSYEKEMELCEESLQRALLFFQKNGIDYDLVNQEGIVKKGLWDSLDKNISQKPCEALYIPYADLNGEEIFAGIKEWARKGVYIYLEENNLNPFYPELAGEIKDGWIVFVKGPSQALCDMKNKGLLDLNFMGAEGILALHKKKEEKDCYLFVNTKETESRFMVEFKDQTPKDAYDPYENREILIEEEGNKNIGVRMPGYGVLLLK